MSKNSDNMQMCLPYVLTSSNLMGRLNSSLLILQSINKSHMSHIAHMRNSYNRDDYYIKL